MKRLMIAIAAAALAMSAQATYVQPGITINGTTPASEGTYSGYTYKDGMFTLTSSGATYTFAGQDTSGNVCINAAVGCTIVLQEGFKLDLRPLDTSLTGNRAPIFLSTTSPVTVRVDGEAYLYGPDYHPGLRVWGGQTVILTQGSDAGVLRATGGGGSAGIGSGYHITDRSKGCGDIFVRCKVKAYGQGSAAGIGEGSECSYEGTSTITIDNASADVYAAGDAAGIGKSPSSPSKMAINISAGDVQAEGYSGAGIGTGEGAHGRCDITISGGSALATGGEHSAGIGSGYLADAAMDINITGGIAITAGLSFEPQIKAHAGDNAACIGTGYKSGSDMGITISGGYVEAYDAGANAAGIGGGYSASVPSITITGGTVLAEGDPDVASVDDIGAGRDPKNSAVCEVTGGNIRLIKGKGHFTNGGTALNCVRVAGLGGSSYDPVSVSLTTAAGAYGNKDIRSFPAMAIYLWVLPGNYVGQLTVNGVLYDFDTSAGDAVATKAAMCTVTFDANGGSVTPTSQAVGKGAAVGSLPTPTRGGFTFNGWYTAKSGGTKVTASTTVNANVTYYAQWTVKQYKLTFNANGGTVSPGYAVVDYCATCDTFPTPTWTSAHTFNGWYTARTGGTKVTAPWKCTGNKTIYAQWTVKQYKLTFNAAGGKVTPAYVMTDYCATYGTLPTPTKSGYLFGGWYTDTSGGGELVTEMTKCTGNKTVYALWLTTGGDANWARQGNGTLRSGAIGDSEETWLQTTVSGPGSIGFWWMSSSEENYDKLIFSIDGVEKANISGYDYDEDRWLWNRMDVTGAGTHTLRWTYRKDDTGLDGYDQGFVKGVEWTVKQYKLTYNANGGSVSPASKMVGYCKTYGTLPTPTWAGHTFQGWFTAKSGGTQVTAETKCTGNVTIYAQWKVNQYKLSFDANGGTVSPASKMLDYCATCDSFPTPTWGGHTFNGWFTARSGGTKVTAPWKCTGNKTLYAQWTVKQYTVTFNANGGTVSPASQKVNYCATYSLPTPTWSGHTFKGWYTAKTGGTKVTSPAKCTGNVTLYARW